MATKKPEPHYVRGLFEEDEFLRIIADYVLVMRGYSDEGLDRISLMTIIKNVKNRNPKRQFRIEIVFKGKPKLS